jgi:hypothetical protein
VSAKPRVQLPVHGRNRSSPPSSGSGFVRQNSRLTNIGTLSTVGPEPPLHRAIHYLLPPAQLLCEHSDSSIVLRPILPFWRAAAIGSV